MAYNTKKMLEDSNGDLIPQYWDVVEQVFKPLTNDPQDVRLTGSIEVIKDFGIATVTAGSQVDILPIGNREKYKELRYGFRTFPEGDYTLILRFYVGEEIVESRKTEFGTEYRGTGSFGDVVTNRCRVTFQNNSSTNRSITGFQILGVL